jgi:hypothetical protein
VQALAQEPATQPVRKLPPAAPPPLAPGEVKVDVTPPDFRFGEVWQGAETKREFTIKNNGETALRLKADANCGCTVPTQPKSPLEPGESTTITVRYDTTRPGQAHKKAFIKLAETNQQVHEIPVEGTVKAVWEAKPSDRVVFQDLELDAEATQTVTLENKTGKPLNLRLQPEQDFGKFNIELKEVKAGEVYELKATTKPPLTKGFNRAAVQLDPGATEYGRLTINVSANVQPRVMAIPLRLPVAPDATEATAHTVRVQYVAAKPVKIVGVKTDVGPVQWEELPAQQSPNPENKFATHQLRVQVPPAAQIPEAGAKLIIQTDDPAPEYKELTIPIVKTTAPQARGNPTTQPRMRVPGTTGGVQPTKLMPMPAPTEPAKPAEPEKPAGGSN